MSDPRSPGQIRVKTIGIIRRGADVLLSFAIDPDSGHRYGRFLGGGVETGERADEALRRELREELGVDIEPPSRLGVLENLFESPHRRIHEIIFVFAAAFTDATLYRREQFPIDEAACDGPAIWVPIERLQRGDVAVYPPELLDLLDASPTSNPDEPPAV